MFRIIVNKSHQQSAISHQQHLWITVPLFRSGIKIKRPADLSIVERLGGFWCCKDKTFIWIVQGFWKKVRKWRWFLTDVGCFGRPGDCPLSSSTACSILHQSMTRAIFPSLSCCHRRTHGNSTTVRY